MDGWNPTSCSCVTQSVFPMEPTSMSSSCDHRAHCELPARSEEGTGKVGANISKELGSAHLWKKDGVLKEGGNWQIQGNPA